TPPVTPLLPPPLPPVAPFEPLALPFVAPESGALALHADHIDVSPRTAARKRRFIRPSSSTERRSRPDFHGWELILVGLVSTTDPGARTFFAATVQNYGFTETQRASCQPTQYAPSGPCSRFQIGTRCFTSSMSMRHAANASPRWGAAATQTT